MSQEIAKTPTSLSGTIVTENTLRSSERFLTKRQFAALFQVTERTIDRWLLNGELPPESKLTIGGCVRFRPAALEQWIKSRLSGQSD